MSISIVASAILVIQMTTPSLGAAVDTVNFKSMRACEATRPAILKALNDRPGFRALATCIERKLRTPS